ncbi:hypothetical protein ACOME3_003796 [Neoechinorhynchus agilis]
MFYTDDLVHIQIDDKTEHWILCDQLSYLSKEWGSTYSKFYLPRKAKLITNRIFITGFGVDIDVVDACYPFHPHGKIIGFVHVRAKNRKSYVFSEKLLEFNIVFRYAFVTFESADAALKVLKLPQPYSFYINGLPIAVKPAYKKFAVSEDKNDIIDKQHVGTYECSKTVLWN